MKTGLHLALHQQMVLTNDMRQALDILGMGSMDLDKLLEEEFLSNISLGDYEIPNYFSSSNNSSAFAVALDQLGQTHDFRDYLFEQVNLGRFNNIEKQIAKNLIYNLDDDGILRDSEGLYETLAKELNVFIEWIESVRRRLLDLDPVGCGATSVFETLVHQSMFYNPKDFAIIKLLNKLKNNQKHIFSRKDLIYELNLTDLKKLQNLNPRPAHTYSKACTGPEVIFPDVEVTKEDHGFSVTLLKEPSKQINIFKNYRLKNIKDGQKRAQALFKALLYRENSLLKIVKIIVTRQFDWFFNGQELLPLVLQDVASIAFMNESSISRLVRANSLTCSRGTFLLKNFFGTGLDGIDGEGAHSSSAIKNQIKNLLHNENKIKPLSDQDIFYCLNKAGIKISRRTITKYRLSLNIPTAQKRRPLTGF